MVDVKKFWYNWWEIDVLETKRLENWYIIDFETVYKCQVRYHVNERRPRANTIRVPEFHTLSTINHGIKDTQKADWMRNDPAWGRGSLLFYILPLPPDWTDLPFQLLEVGAVSLWISVTIRGENVWADTRTLISWKRFSPTDFITLCRNNRRHRGKTTLCNGYSSCSESFDFSVFRNTILLGALKRVAYWNIQLRTSLIVFISNALYVFRNQRRTIKNFPTRNKK